MLGAPRIGSKFFKRPTEVSVGLENGYPEKTEVKIRTLKEFKIVRIREHRFWWYSVGLLVLLLLIIWLARKSDILRDIGLSPNGNKLKPYSLARCQMAFWFFWVIGSFLYIWLITGAYDIINGSVLALIGIGAGTALGAAAIDIGKQNEAAANQGKVDTLIAELQTVDSRITLLNNQISTSPPNLNSLQLSLLAEQARRDYIKNQITSLINVTLPQASQGFLNDILTDSTGVSFHRFQMATWTVVLGVLFIYSVWNRLSMPEFSATLLGLLGISSGTYLGFKIPEKQN